MQTRKQAIDEFADKLYEQYLIMHNTAKVLSEIYIKFIEERMENYKWKEDDDAGLRTSSTSN